MSVRLGRVDWPQLTPHLLALVAFLWCIVVSAMLWLTPVRYLHDRSDEPGPRFEFVPFREAAAFPLATLLIPTALAWSALSFVRRQKRKYLAVVTIALFAYSFVAGFSVGLAYVPAAGILLCAFLAWPET
jgi:hypothetical protein